MVDQVLSLASVPWLVEGAVSPHQYGLFPLGMHRGATVAFCDSVIEIDNCNVIVVPSDNLKQRGAAVVLVRVGWSIGIQIWVGNGAIEQSSDTLRWLYLTKM